MTAEIEIDGIPEGWELVAVRGAAVGDFILNGAYRPYVSRADRDDFPLHAIMPIVRLAEGYRSEFDPSTRAHIAIKDYAQPRAVPVIFYARNSREEAHIRDLVKDLPSVLVSESE